ncbi:MAG: hypothetical protein ACREBE_08310 [bacterium]
MNSLDRVRFAELDREYIEGRRERFIQVRRGDRRRSSHHNDPGDGDTTYAGSDAHGLATSNKGAIATDPVHALAIARERIPSTRAGAARPWDRPRQEQ